MTADDDQAAKEADSQSDDIGIVYVLTNPAMPDLVKIGMTRRNEIASRLKELYSTGVPFPFECAYAVTVNDAKQVEDALHQAFDPNRENRDREFFKIDPEQAIVILNMLKIDDVTPSFQQDADDVDPLAKLAADNFKKWNPSLVLSELDIPNGADLEFTRRDAVATVIDSEHNRLSYQGNEFAISRLTAILLGGKSNYISTCGRYWRHDVRLLHEMYREVHGI